MSHFSVLVIGPSPDEQLAPYQENNMGDCPKKYLEFHDVEDEYKPKYDNEGTNQVELENGEWVFEFDEQFKQGEWTDRKTVVPPHLKVVNRKFSEIYSTFDIFMKEWGSYKKDPEKNRYGYWENPNAKWDWYGIGGRYSNLLILKDGSKADEASKGEIDFDAMLKEEISYYDEQYDKMANATNGIEPPTQSWAELIEGKDDINSLRTLYNNHPWLQKVHDVGFWSGDPVEFFCVLKGGYAAFMKKHVKSSFTFAVVKDGKWHERGEMGWWGITLNEKHEDEWENEYKKLIDGLPDDTMFTIMDCHI